MGMGYFVCSIPNGEYTGNGADPGPTILWGFGEGLG